MLKTAYGLLAPPGLGAKLSILILHRVLPLVDPLLPGELDARRFDAICGWLRSWFNVLPLEWALKLRAEGQLPERPLCITFDDGYADNCSVALPILQRHRLSATFFISTGFLDGGTMWNDRVVESVRQTVRPNLDLRDAAGLNLGLFPLRSTDERRQAVDRLLRRIKHLPPLQREATVAAVIEAASAKMPDDLMLTTPQLLVLRDAGMGLGAHTVNHPILAKLDLVAAEREIIGGRDRLQALIGRRVGLFAYPNGKLGDDFTANHADMARRIGFDAAVTTEWGVANQKTDPFLLPRFTPWDQSRLRFGLRLLNNLRGA